MTILWPPFVGWMFFCSLLFRILSRTRVVRETIAAKGKKVDDVKLFDWSDRNDYFYVEFDEPDSELLINFDGTLY